MSREDPCRFGHSRDRRGDCEQVVAQPRGLTLRTRGEEARAKQTRPGTKARRWVVERAHSRLNRFRRLLVRWGKKAAKP